jgi:ankyrin repeat protein
MASKDELYEYIKIDDVTNLKKYISSKNVNEYRFAYRDHILFDICCEEATLCLEYVISIGVNVFQNDEYGGCLLSYTIFNKSTACLRMLLDLGVNVNTIDIDSETPLDGVIRYSNNGPYPPVCPDAFKLLIDRGADINLVKLPIPNRIHEYIANRTQIRNKAVTIIGIHKFKRTTIPIIRDVVKHISKHIWSYRLQ